MFKMLSRKTQEGFTLVEIMVVLVILGILAAISVPVYTNYVRKAKINEAISNVGTLANAIRIYKMEKGEWPQKTDLANFVNVDEWYFTITWTKPDKNSPLRVLITSKNFDAQGTIEYTIDTNYQGTWKDVQGQLLATYANYLIRT